MKTHLRVAYNLFWMNSGTLEKTTKYIKQEVQGINETLEEAEGRIKEMETSL